MGGGGFLKDQPILAGCLGLVGLGTVALCGLGLLAGLGVRGCTSALNEATGVDSMLGTVGDAVEAGFTFNVSVTNGETTFGMHPTELRAVTCDDIKAVLFPHLNGSLETVRVESSSQVLQSDGTSTVVPVTCTWSGSPGEKSLEPDSAGGSLNP